MSFRFKHSLPFKYISAVLACLLFFNNTCLFADNTSESALISAPAFFADENREAYLQARLMCHIIDKLAKSKNAKILNKKDTIE